MGVSVEGDFKNPQTNCCAIADFTLFTLSSLSTRGGDRALILSAIHWAAVGELVMRPSRRTATMHRCDLPSWGRVTAWRTAVYSFRKPDIETKFPIVEFRLARAPGEEASEHFVSTKA